MKGKIIYGRHGIKTYFVDGKMVTEEVFRKAFPPQPMAANGRCSLVGWSKPLVNDALAVHPTQIAEAMERNAKRGLHVQYNADGCPILTSQEERRQLIEIENTCIPGGVRDNNGGYGDMARTEPMPKPKKKLSEEFIAEGVRLNKDVLVKAARKKFTGKD